MLDAREEPPAHCITLTTNDPDTPPAAYREGSAQLFRRMRKEIAAVEYFGAVEFTTGKAASSGGRRRMHGHYLVKGLGPEVDVLLVEDLVRETWRKTTGAYVVEVAALLSPGAALGYLGLHHRKPEQAPPAEWRGMTERASRGYWSRPIAELRKQARQELAVEAHAWRTGLPLEVAALELELQGAPELRQVRVIPGGEVLLEPLGTPSWLL